MKEENRQQKIINVTRWIAICLVLLTLSTIFMPFATEQLFDGTIISYPTLRAVFGGDFVFSDNTLTYTITFNLNLYLLIAYQLAVLSGVAFFFLNRKRANLIVALVLSFTSFIAMLLMLQLVKLGTPGFVVENLQIGYGPLISCGSLLIVQLITLFHLLFDKRFTK